MKTYEVYFTFTGTLIWAIDAKTEDEAEDIAERRFAGMTAQEIVDNIGWTDAEVCVPWDDKEEDEA